MARTGILTYNPRIYTPRGLRNNLSEREARKEYSRLRSIAIKRLKNFEGTEYTEEGIYKRYRGAFPTLKGIKNERQLYNALTEVATFLTSPRSTITGIKKIEKKSIDTLHAHGYTFVNRENFKNFGRYMQRARAVSIGRFFDSIRAADLYEEYIEDDDKERALEAFKKFEQEEIKELARNDLFNRLGIKGIKES